MALTDEQEAQLRTELTTTATERDTIRGELTTLRTEREQLVTKYADYDQIKAGHEQAAAKLKDLDALKLERDKFAGEVDKYIRRDRESAIVSGLVEKMPGLSAFEAAAAITKLHEEKVVDRYGEKAADEVGKAVEALKTRAPNFATRPALVGGGGSHNKQSPATTQAARSLIG